MSKIDTNSLTINGTPNFHNERVLAGFLDIVGLNFTNAVNEMYENGGVMTENHAKTFVQLHTVLKNMRDICGIGTDWTSHNQAEIVVEVTKQIDAFRNSERDRAIAEFRAVCAEHGIPKDQIDSAVFDTLQSMGLKPSASDAADQILEDLRSAGDIGTRAV